MTNKKLLVSIIISLAVSAFLALLLYAGAFQDLSFRLSDRLYIEQKPLSEIVIIEIDDKSIQETGRWPWPRNVFASAIEKLKDASVIGIDVSFFETSENDSELSNAIISNKNIVLVSECVFKEGNCTWQKPIFNASSGFANIITDKSGIARSLPLLMENEKSFSAVISEKYGKKISEKSEKLIVRFSRHRKISFSDLFDNKEKFDGKIVIIGATAKDLHDDKATPVGVLSGADIHASAVQTILTGKTLNYQTNSGIALAILVLSLLTSIIMFRFRIILSVIIYLLLIILYFLVSLFAFDSGVVMNILYPSASIILTFVFITVLYYVMEAREKRWVSELFGKYVSPNVADELMKKGKEAVNLNGTRKTVTILFADMRGFTSLSEKISPRQVVSILNRYLSRMTDIVFKYNGTLDKYVGDEIMATYNVPLDMDDHALMAVKTAIEMQKESRKLMKVKYGIGINTGPVIVGNIGSKKRLDYTVIGDAVNLAARLCGKCEGDQILISEETYHLVKDKIKTHFIGDVQVKGKAKPIKVYEVVY